MAATDVGDDTELGEVVAATTAASSTDDVEVMALLKISANSGSSRR